MDQPLFNPATRTISSSEGQELRLQYKTNQVLTILIDRAPDTVTRTELIDQIWQGRTNTGEKGLTQAMWQIRQLLGDNAANSTLVETIPRIGYRWIGPDIRQTPVAEARVPYVRELIASAVAIFIAVTINSTGGADKEYVAASVHLESRNLVVTTTEGCKLTVVPKRDKYFSRPVLSEDRLAVAFQVHQGDSCRIATISLNGLDHQLFGLCPNS